MTSEDRAEQLAQQQQLLAIHRRNLAELLRQQAIHGTAYVPPSIRYGIQENRASIQRIKEVLHNWGLDVENHPDDEELSDQQQTTTQLSKKLALGIEEYRYSMRSNPIFSPSNFTEIALEAFNHSQELLFMYKHTQLDVEHVFMSLLQQDEGITEKVLSKMDIDVVSLGARLDKALKKRFKITGEMQYSQHIYITQRLKNVLLRLTAIKSNISNKYLDDHNILIEVIKEGEGEVAALCNQFNIRYQIVDSHLSNLVNYSDIMDFYTPYQKGLIFLIQQTKQEEEFHQILDKHNRRLQEIIKLYRWAGNISGTTNALKRFEQQCDQIIEHLNRSCLIALGIPFDTIVSSLTSG